MFNMRSTTLWVRTDDYQNTAVECRWATSQTTSLKCGDCTPIQTIDVIFTAKPNLVHPNKVTTSSSHELLLESHQSEFKVTSIEQENAPTFLRLCFEATATTHGPRLARFIIPLHRGTIIRSDILSYRLRDSFWVETASTLASPLQAFPGTPLPVASVTLSEILKASAGATLVKPEITLHNLETGVAIFPPEVEADFAAKLSIPWISRDPIPRKRLVLVGTSNQDPAGGGWTQFARRAAVALGIDLVVIDREDGWMARDEYASWYDVRFTLPPSWWAHPSAEALTQLVTGMRVDGMVTFIEALQVPVSVAASLLGLPHEQSSAFESATNKFNLALNQKRSSILASCPEEIMASVRPCGSGLEFPLIVKPCFGLNSEGVTRVDEPSQLQDAIVAARISRRVKSEVGDRVLVERYCEGPEVDVNIVFIDGEVMFDEISDDFPKGADVSEATADDNNSNNLMTTGPHGVVLKPALCHRRNFLETNMVFPSILPDNELALLRNAVKETIQGLGFKNGVMHVEARIAQSKYRYQSVDGVLDLRPRERKASHMECTARQTESKTDEPTPWIIEINPRPPGLFASQTPGSVYGIDYWAISLLLAAGDKARAAALSRPFEKGAQSHAVLVMVRAEFDPACEGIFDSDDVCEVLLARHPELREHMGRYACLLQRGQKIPHPEEGKNTFVAYMNVFSRTSRQAALEIAKKVREEIRYTIR